MAIKIKGREISQEEFDKKTAEDIIKFAADNLNGKVALASSFGAEDVVLIDIISRVGPSIGVFTIDTGRLHEETYRAAEKIRERYGIKIKAYFPDREKVEKLETEKGLYSFYESIGNRKECCQIRKVEQLKRALSKLDAWITGLRRDQIITREKIHKIENDEANGIIKINPLADWTEKHVWDYIKRNNVPYNKLHDKSFPSIGCEPCTRPVKKGEDIRAGRWWWEHPKQKECGLHVKERCM